MYSLSLVQAIHHFTSFLRTFFGSHTSGNRAETMKNHIFTWNDFGVHLLPGFYTNVLFGMNSSYCFRCRIIERTQSILHYTAYSIGIQHSWNNCYAFLHHYFHKMLQAYRVRRAEFKTSTLNGVWRSVEISPSQYKITKKKKLT